MSRRGVWELKEILLTYSPRSGSSQGVVEYVQTRLVPWATANPQFEIKTKVKPAGHPSVLGIYSNRFQRGLTLRNLDPNEIQLRLDYLRNTLGHVIPEHSRLSKGPRESRVLSGMSRTARSDADNLYLAMIKSFPKEYTFFDLVDQLGMNGTVQLLNGFQSSNRELYRVVTEKAPHLINTAKGTSFSPDTQSGFIPKPVFPHPNPAHPLPNPNSLPR
uniref:Large ribosomal subunit protein mL43 n=1 Tax=Timspurckia oligopyrenoides TaxID=708627 RepID=A0A7S0ZED4_9RHOD|mmetsp:Transcript_1955/g.3478  ORF Transcript_1955/g.3478 Transcript_1955/m.3478 type:complete len:217 (+) Transcript_1955:65-715(+)|eukprot:CAMPEP_0182442178 /NCGR_PEP_ID=MMETSP1172-20130603/1131_1 /TAXON_ID=708627 /ORGANISM="Timspurckia oligopyrenoides, Strain CCMP3278" /LENGTH=216 /DNA_ID=CAMNT_0024636903 /DNA_START=44 /DNA_END=694 /DNA_ORIENTATION=+